MLEIERKFLVDAAIRNTDVLEGIGGGLIRQAYFEDVDGLGELRVRHDFYRDKLTMTIKDPVPNSDQFVREETESEISVELFYRLYSRAPFKVSKFRYRIGPWELDVYEDSHAGLAILEIELATVETPVPEFPSMLKPFVIADVSHHRGFYNKQLAMYGVPELVFPE